MVRYGYAALSLVAAFLSWDENYQEGSNGFSVAAFSPQPYVCLSHTFSGSSPLRHQPIVASKISKTVRTARSDDVGKGDDLTDGDLSTNVKLESSDVASAENDLCAAAAISTEPGHYRRLLVMTRQVEEDDDDDEDEFSYGRREDTATSDPTYRVTLPITQTVPRETVANPTAGEKAADDIQFTLGLCVRQVSPGGLMSSLALDLDTLRFRTYGEERRRSDFLASDDEAAATTTTTTSTAWNEDDNVGSVQILDSSQGEVMEDSFSGLVVSSVVRGGMAWKAGVRVGDALLATSATIGGSLWAKKTLDGVRSAISSRKLTSQKMTFQFRRSGSHMTPSQVVEEFDLTLPRPIGIQIEDAKDGGVVVTGFTEAPQSLAQSTIQVGDRVVAADSTFGNRMWPVSSVEGLVSACTARLPGQPVRLRFERVVQVGEWSAGSAPKIPSSLATPTGESDAEEYGRAASDGDAGLAPSLTGAVDGFRKLKQSTTTTTASSTSAEKAGTATQKMSSSEASSPPNVIKTTGSKTHKLLLSRCRDVLRRYAYGEEAASNKAISSAVADRVLEALADASAPLDAKTLLMVMNAYLTCNRPDGAIRAFEAGVGLSSDGSSNPVNVVIEGKKVEGARLPADPSSLDGYTATALLRAHAMRGDFNAARGVLAAMEADVAFEVEGRKTAAWPPGPPQASMKPNAQCYNIVLAAASKAGNIQVALDLFDSMAGPGTKSGKKPAKNNVSYNTLIEGFSKVGRLQDAFTVFYDMQQSGVKPDKFSYTSLIKAVVESGDIEGACELLAEMRQTGVETDILPYNTVIKALCDRLRIFQAKRLINLMESSGIAPDAVTYGLLMKGLLKSNKPGPCLTLFETACSDERTAPLMENIRLYTTAITAASTMGDYDRALDLVRRMKQAGLKPNLKTLTALMGAHLSSGQPHFALEVYEKIKKPDGYAMTMGMRAYCDSGDFESALSLLQNQADAHHEMSGRDIMVSYNKLLRSALEMQRLDVARRTLSDLLGRGYIPSKTTLRGIVEGLGLLSPQSQSDARFYQRGDESLTDITEKFEFLLFVLDSMNRRKLPSDGLFYASVLSEGGRVGGLPLRISKLLMRARSLYEGTDMTPKEEMEEEETDGEELDRDVVTWEGLYRDLRQHADGSESPPLKTLPQLRVRVTGRELRQVLATEQRLRGGRLRRGGGGGGRRGPRQRRGSLMSTNNGERRRLRSNSV